MVPENGGTAWLLSPKAIMESSSSKNLAPPPPAHNSDSSAVQVMLLLVMKGQRGGTRARYAPARLFSASSLGQLLVRGGLPSAIINELRAPQSGLITTLIDLIPFSVPLASANRPGPGGEGGRMGAGGPGEVERRGGAGGRGARAGGPSLGLDMAEGVKSAALQLVGVTGDLRFTLGLQVG